MIGWEQEKSQQQSYTNLRKGSKILRNKNFRTKADLWCFYVIFNVWKGTLGQFLKSFLE